MCVCVLFFTVWLALISSLCWFKGCVCVYVCIHVYVCVCTNASDCLHACVCVCDIECVCMCVCVCMSEREIYTALILSVVCVCVCVCVCMCRHGGKKVLLSMEAGLRSSKLAYLHHFSFRLPPSTDERQLSAFPYFGKFLVPH